MPVIMLGGSRAEPGNPVPTIHYKADSETIYAPDATLTIATNRGSLGATGNMTTVVGTPQWKTNIFNGYPAYYFTTNEAIYATNIGSGAAISAAAGTMFIVWKCASAVSSYPFFITEIGVAVRAVFETLVTTEQARASNYDGTQDFTAAKTMTNDTAYIGTWLHTGGNLYFGQSDTRTASMASVASGNTSVAAGDDIFMGGSTASLFMNGYIAEALCFSTALSEAERQEWEQWLAFKYGITLPY